MHKYFVCTLGLEQMNKNCTVAPPPLSLSLSLSFPPQLFIHIKLLIIFHDFKTFQLQNEET